MINAILQIRSDLMNQIRGMLSAPELPQTANNLRIFNALKTMLDHEGELGWWKNETGGQTFIPVDVLLEEDDLDFLLSLPGNRIKVLKALNQDGTEYGETVSYDVDGNRIVSGVPVFADNTPAFLGDKQLFDVDGNPTTTAPMNFEEMPQFLGWKRV